MTSDSSSIGSVADVCTMPPDVLIDAMTSVMVAMAR